MLLVRPSGEPNGCVSNRIPRRVITRRDNEVHLLLYTSGLDCGFTRGLVTAPELSGVVGADRVLKLDSLVGRSRVLRLDPLVGRSRVLGLDSLLGRSREKWRLPGGDRELGPSSFPRALITLHHQYHAHDLRSG